MFGKFYEVLKIVLIKILQAIDKFFYKEKSFLTSSIIKLWYS